MKGRKLPLRKPKNRRADQEGEVNAPNICCLDKYFIKIIGIMQPKRPQSRVFRSISSIRTNRLSWSTVRVKRPLTPLSVRNERNR